MIKPPSASGPSARAPEGRPPEGRPPEIKPLTVTPPGVSSTSFTWHTKITAGAASTPQERQTIAENQAHRESAAHGVAAYGVIVDFAGMPVTGNDSVMIYNITYTARPLPGSALS